MTVDIYKLPMDILIDGQISSAPQDTDNRFKCVCFSGLWAGTFGHRQQFTVQKLKAPPAWTERLTAVGPSHLTTPSPPPAQPLPFDHINRRSRTHLLVFSYHLESNIKRGREPELLIKSEKYGRRSGGEIKTVAGRVMCVEARKVELRCERRNEGKGHDR